MRLSSAFLGIVGFLVLIVATILCSVLSYTLTRDGVVDARGRGSQVNSVNEIIQAILDPASFNVAKVTETPTRDLIVEIASPSAIVTLAPTDIVATQEGIIAPAETQVLATFTPEPTLEPTIDPAQAALQQVGPREMNILLMGIDERVGFEQERAYRTDSMMIVHIDPIRKSAGVISFPRDLWVNIPNYNADRLNNANYIGDINAYPGGGGPALAMETFRNNFGIRVDYYIMVNFTVFESVVDILAPEGIEINVREVIRDPDYPDAGFGYINVEFDPGIQRMNGVRLLQYARTRATEGSDLDRARRQQEVIEALRQHVLSAGGIQTFITQLGRLWTELAGSYRTNLDVTHIIGLAYLMTDIPRDNIRYAVIGPGYIDPRQTQDARDILVPIHSRIQELIQSTFYPTTAADPADLRANAVAENATIRIFNNTTIAGLAGRTKEYLIGQGVTVGDLGNMPTPANSVTIIYNYGGADRTAEWLAQILRLTPDRIQRGTDGIATSGIVISVGTDIQALLGGQ